MAPKFANLKPRELVQALEKAGFQRHAISGSHVQVKHPDRPGRITVPYHERFDLPKHIVKSIRRREETVTAFPFQTTLASQCEVGENRKPGDRSPLSPLSLSEERHFEAGP